MSQILSGISLKVHEEILVPEEKSKKMEHRSPYTDWAERG